jgi:hypothetical protein
MYVKRINNLLNMFSYYLMVIQNVPYVCSVMYCFFSYNRLSTNSDMFNMDEKIWITKPPQRFVLKFKFLLSPAMAYSKSVLCTDICKRTFCSNIKNKEKILT